MTVAELIEKLKEMPGDWPVLKCGGVWPDFMYEETELHVGTIRTNERGWMDQHPDGQPTVIL